MNRKNLLFAAVCLAVLAFVLPGLFRSERSRVRAVFVTAAENLEKTGPENLLAAGLKAQALGELVDGTLHLRLPELGHDADFDAAEVQRQVALARNQMGNLHVEFRDIRIEFPARGEATATADALVTGDLDGLRGREVRAVAAQLRKNPATGKWRFRDVRVEPVLVQ